jgi:zinc protease
MTGKIARVNPYISGITEGLRGSSTPKDLEYLFQMTYAYFTDLNFDQEALKALSKSSLVFLKHGIYASKLFSTRVLHVFKSK